MPQYTWADVFKGILDPEECDQEINSRLRFRIHLISKTDIPNKWTIHYHNPSEQIIITHTLRVEHNSPHIDIYSKCRDGVVVAYIASQNNYDEIARKIDCVLFSEFMFHIQTEKLCDAFFRSTFVKAAEVKR